MKLILSGALALGLLGSALFAATEFPEDVHARPEVQTPAAAAQSVPNVFRLWKAGRETGCAVTRGAALAKGRSAVKLSPGCSELRSLAGVRYWQTGERDTVVLAAADGHALLEFAASDGVAYETFRPGAPLMAMVAID